MTRDGGEVRIGISGWTYGPWRGVFYPPDLAQKRELEYASRQLNSIEINGTFYSMQRPETFGKWFDQTPDDFVFAIKGSRYITHMRRLRDVETPLANFFAQGLLRLNQKLGPILWQFPPNLPFDEERFATFLELLPGDTQAAAELAGRHDRRMSGRSAMEIDRRRKLRHAIEVRHDSFEDARFIRLLRRHHVALVFADTAQRWGYAEDVTAPFVYLRLHGAEEMYASGYEDQQLRWWKRRIDRWRHGGEPSDAKRWAKLSARKRSTRPVFVYFDNDVKVKAPFNAMRLAELVGT